MNFRPRHLLIRWLLPVTWKLDASQKTRVLQEFAQTELDSAWQSIYALERVEDPRLRALLFMHAFEELFHSDLFSGLAHRTARSIPLLPLTRREPLMPIEGGDRKSAVEFFAFLAIGESEIQRDFGVYERAIPDEDARQLFGKIRKDEEYHAKDSAIVLEQLTRDAGLSLARIRIRHLGALAFKRYVSVMGKFGTIPMTVLLFVAYALFGGILSRQAKQRLELSGAKQLEFLKRQQEEFDVSLRKSQ
jgi:hypothetical protein